MDTREIKDMLDPIVEAIEQLPLGDIDRECGMESIRKVEACLRGDRLPVRLCLYGARDKVCPGAAICEDSVTACEEREEEEGRLPPRAILYAEIDAERERQDAKWGEQNHPIRDEQDGAVEFYKEEAETFRKICDIKAKNNRLTWYDIIIEEFFEAFAENTSEGQRAELVQMVAVGVAMIECIDRRAREARIVRLPPSEPLYVQQAGRVQREVEEPVLCPSCYAYSPADSAKCINCGAEFITHDSVIAELNSSLEDDDLARQ